MKLLLCHDKAVLRIAGVAVSLAFAHCVALAETYTWIGGRNGSWQSPKNFSPEGNPGAMDEVLLPIGTTCLDATDDGELAAANAIKRIRPNDNCTLEVDVGDRDCTLLFAFTYQAQGGRNRGKLIKKGSGALLLGSARDEFLSNSIRYDYYSDYDIVAGAVKLPQDATAGIAAKLGNVAISNNATLFTLATSGTSLTRTYVLDLWGEPGSVITNTAALSNSNPQILQTGGSSVSVFAGHICAPVRWWGQGVNHLMGIDNTFTSSFLESANNGRGFDGPYVGAASFGRKTFPSSGGVSGDLVSRDSGGAFKYLGSGEETDANLTVSSLAATPYPAYLSGGDVGGLVWNGLWQPADASLMQRLVISGEGSKTNIMKGAIRNRLRDDGDYSFFIRKQGRGTWRIEDSSKGLDTGYQMLGVWGVDEGTLQFTSLAETNFVSSLGMATHLFRDYCGVRDESKRVPYAFTLGGDTTEGTLEYVGAEDEFCSERPIWLYGDGAFVNNGSAKIRFKGVSSVADGEAPEARGVMFTVGGDGMATNELFDITDSASRPVSVVKDGDGIWALGGELSFRGSLTVKRGRLIVRRPEKYTWYRWMITSKVGWGSDYAAYFEMQEFALFSAAGLRQNYGLSLNSNYASLEPGQVAYGTDKRPAPNAATQDIDKLFDDSKTDPGWRGVMCAPNTASTKQRPVVADSLSWIPIIMRLPANAEQISSYDIVFYQSSAHTRSVASYFVDGSVDGVHWNRLSTVDEIGVVSGNTWQYAGSGFGSGAQRNTAHTDGYTFKNPQPTTLPNVLNNVKSVSVAGGAILECNGDIAISNLSFDCTEGGGTFVNCAFSSTPGVITIANAPGRGVAIETGWVFDGCSGVGNLSGWSVSDDGITKSPRRIRVEGGNRVTIVPLGVRIVIR